MKNTELRFLSQGMPDEFILHTIATSSVYRAIEEFFDEYFRGSVIMERNNYTAGYIEISPDGLAFFFKLLFKAVYGESTVMINMSSKDDVFYIKAEWKKRRIISEKELFELKNAARLAGFDINLHDDGDSFHAELSVKLKITKYITVYAVSSEKLRESLTRVFFLL